jgi:hypothetical protein
MAQDEPSQPYVPDTVTHRVVLEMRIINGKTILCYTGAREALVAIGPALKACPIDLAHDFLKAAGMIRDGETITRSIAVV